ncbi:uncharacterized protein LOC107271498 isoform X2 [Cephus cinctus]|uniref:Uncharacterized protein LOC107271498 isoform X2 n=1 Tax=Cephus cinctus TaxID=211228 RepID=A0AAJ7RP54_CEPCN|nr:uncharacterized protein LOC107271498 isoform X2 [Cephus cinctus]
MRRGLIRYDEHLDSSTSTQEDSCLSSELDLLNPRVPGPAHPDSSRRSASHPREDSPSLLDYGRKPRAPGASVAPDTVGTKLLTVRKSAASKITSGRGISTSLQCLPVKGHPHKYEHQVTFADSRYSSGEGPTGKADNKLRRGKGTPRIIKAIRHHARKHINGSEIREDQSASSIYPREENSKSSVVVLYHGKSPTPPRSPRSPRSLVRSSKSEDTLCPKICSSGYPDRDQSTRKLQYLPSPRTSLRRKRVRRYRQGGRRQETENASGVRESKLVQLAQRDQWRVERQEVPLGAHEGSSRRGRSSSQTVQQSQRGTYGILRTRRTVKEQCGPSDPLAFGSRQMAHRLSLPREEFINRDHYPAGGLGTLMQQAQMHPGENNTEENKRVFPFQATPSGNLKIIPNQVVFESKKVSVLVADPRHAKVDVKAELSRPTIDLPPSLSSSITSQAQAQQKFSRSDNEHRIKTQPHRSKTHQKEAMDQKQTVHSSSSVKTSSYTEVPLSSLGFTGEQPIDWENIILPEKTNLYQELARRITNYMNADCIVRLGQDEFHCHLLVLQSYSSYFDKRNDKEVDLTESSVTSKAFSIIYDWMISANNDGCHLLRRDNILEIFTAAQYLGIKELEEQCWAFIDNDELFSEDTAFLLYLEARKIGNTAVMQLMVPRIMKFFLMLVSTKDFLDLDVDELCLLLRSNYICVNSEMEVLMSAVRWLMHDWDNKRQHMLEVLKCVRFGLIAPWQLVDVKRNPENPEFMELMSYPEIQKMVDDGLAFVIIKYWYGNQSQDYYRWIDLLGLTEPTNRNWAGEDKNYVTYREFLVYLEDYQKTKISELKSRKTRVRPTPPNSPPKDSPSPVTRTRVVNSQSPSGLNISGQGGDAPNHPSRTFRNNGRMPAFPASGPGGAMMSPEILNHYLSSLDRNSKGNNSKILKQVNNKAEFNCQTEANELNNVKANFHGDGETLINSSYNSVNPGGASQESRNQEDRSRELTTEKEIPRDAQRHHQELRNALLPLKKYPRKYPKIVGHPVDEPGACKSSCKSEEEAATRIQSFYRGFKMRRSSSDEKQKAKMVAELLSAPGDQEGCLQKPMDPVRVSTSFVTSGITEVERMENSWSPRRKRRESCGAVENSGNCRDYPGQTQRLDLHKDLQGLRFDVTAPRPTPRSQQNPRTQGPPLFKSSANQVVTAKPLETIKVPAFSHNCDARFSSVSVSDNTDTDDLFSPRIREKSLVDLQIKETYGDPSYPNKNLYRPKPRSREVHFRTDNTSHDRSLAVQHPNLGTNLNMDNLENSLFFREREAVLVFGGIDPNKEYGCTGNTGKDMYRYSPIKNEWEFVGEIPEPRHHHSVAYLKGRIYLAGGADPRDSENDKRSLVMDTVWSYDPITRCWFSEPDMLTPRKNFGLVVSHEKIYAIGGQDRNGIALKTVEVFDPNESKWQEVQPMQTARVGLASAKYQDLIWVAGGMTRSKKEPLLREVECYDPPKNLWRKAEPLRASTCFASLYVLAKRLYLIGGAGNARSSFGNENFTESMNNIDMWDPSLCLWRQQAKISFARHGHNVASIGDRLMIIGGVSTIYTRTLKSVECYSCELDTWHQNVSDLPYAVSGHSTVSLPAANTLTDC